MASGEPPCTLLLDDEFVWGVAAPSPTSVDGDVGRRILTKPCLVHDSVAASRWVPCVRDLEVVRVVGGRRAFDVLGSTPSGLLWALRRGPASTLGRSGGDALSRVPRTEKPQNPPQKRPASTPGRRPMVLEHPPSITLGLLDVPCRTLLRQGQSTRLGPANCLRYPSPGDKKEKKKKRTIWVSAWQHSADFARTSHRAGRRRSVLQTPAVSCPWSLRAGSVDDLDLAGGQHLGCDRVLPAALRRMSSES